MSMMPHILNAATHLMWLARKPNIQVHVIELFHTPRLWFPRSMSIHPDLCFTRLVLTHQRQPSPMLVSPVVLRVPLSLAIRIPRRTAPPKHLVDRLFHPRLVLFQRRGVGRIVVRLHGREEEFIVSHVFR